VHATPLAPEYPALHTQSLIASLLVGELLWEGQLAQLAAAVAEYVPAAQAPHVPIALAPANAELVPAMQLEQDDCAMAPAVVPYVPAAQSLQSSTWSCPVATRNLPVGQSVQAAPPVSCLYLPCAHRVHVLAVGAVAPALQRQAVWLTLLGGEFEFVWQVSQAVIRALAVLYVPPGQSAQPALPGSGLRVPGPQAVHRLPSLPVYPALHVQAVMTVLLCGELELAGQPVQVAAAAAEKVSPAQLVHVLSRLAPTSLDFLPAAQEMQPDAAPAPAYRPYLPVPHNMQSLSASFPAVARNLPVGQFSHVLAAMAAVVVENVPKPHRKQELAALDPRNALYLPGKQLMHVLGWLAPTVVEYLPLSHDVQAPRASLPSFMLYVPAKQFVHTVPDMAFRAVEYLPVPHSVHSDIPPAA